MVIWVSRHHCAAVWPCREAQRVRHESGGGGVQTSVYNTDPCGTTYSYGFFAGGILQPRPRAHGVQNVRATANAIPRRASPRTWTCYWTLKMRAVQLKGSFA